MRRLLILLVPLLSLCAGCHGHPRVWSIARADPETLRQTASGPILGGASRAGGHAWLGVPFAAPPVGPLRFRAPQPPSSWKETRPALSPPPGCPQFGLRGDEVVGEEDCLYLDIYAPRFAAAAVPTGAARRPVMVWIHGGGNSIGAASQQDGGWLAVTQDVIVVAIDYRLGPLGWLRLPALRAETSDPLEQSGNFGTLDQIRALAWVRDNIAAFGGDPGNVTIFGESAGGTDVYALLVAPPARGLFARAIVESGVLSRTTTDDAERLVDDTPAGYEHSSGEALLALLTRRGLARDRADAKARLAGMRPEEIAAFLRGLDVWSLLAVYGEGRTGPMLDFPAVFHDGALLPAGPFVDALASADPGSRVPLLVGSNRDEYKLFELVSPHYVQRHGRRLVVVDEGDFEATAEWISRGWKAASVDVPAAALARAGATVFAYRFDWRGEPTVLGNDLAHLIGAAHAVELPFVFGERGGQPFFGRTADDRELSATMMSYWAEFARHGAPGRGGRGDRPEWAAWDESSPTAPKYLLLDACRPRPPAAACTASWPA